MKFMNITQQARDINQPHGYTSVIAAAFNYVTLLCTQIPLIFVHGYKDIPCNYQLQFSHAQNRLDDNGCNFYSRMTERRRMLVMTNKHLIITNVVERLLEKCIKEKAKIIM